MSICWYVQYTHTCLFPPKNTVIVHLCLIRKKTDRLGFYTSCKKEKKSCLYCGDDYDSYDQTRTSTYVRNYVALTVITLCMCLTPFLLYADGDTDGWKEDQKKHEKRNETSLDADDSRWRTRTRRKKIRRSKRDSEKKMNIDESRTWRQHKELLYETINRRLKKRYINTSNLEKIGNLLKKNKKKEPIMVWKRTRTRKTHEPVWKHFP